MSAEKQPLDHWWAKIDEWRARKSLAFRNSDTAIKPQYAVQRLYALTKDKLGQIAAGAIYALSIAVGPSGGLIARARPARHRTG